VTSTNATHAHRAEIAGTHAAKMTAADASTTRSSGAPSTMPAASASTMSRGGDFSAKIYEGAKRNGRCEQFDKSARHDAYSCTNASSLRSADHAHRDCALEPRTASSNVTENFL
jgi:hypothetical protein